MAVSKRLRFEVFRRDNHACRYCGRAAPEVKLTIDHVVPETLGGTDEPSNLVTACADCNSGKSATPPDAELVADVAEDALRWRRAMEVAHEIAERDRAAKAAFRDEFHERWTDWTWTDSKGKKRTSDLPGSWEVRVGELMAAGLSIADMRECIDVALSARYVRDEFAYFITVARNRIALRQEVAAQVLRQGLV